MSYPIPVARSRRAARPDRSSGLPVRRVTSVDVMLCVRVAAARPWTTDDELMKLQWISESNHVLKTIAFSYDGKT
jgi:hypothetical protein